MLYFVPLYAYHKALETPIDITLCGFSVATEVLAISAVNGGFVSTSTNPSRLPEKSLRFETFMM